jgi:hypothetical protein
VKRAADQISHPRLRACRNENAARNCCRGRRLGRDRDHYRCERTTYGAGAIRASLLLLVALSGFSVTGCGSSSSGPVAVRVGKASISAAIVRHWARAFSHGKEFGVGVAESHGTARERTLDFLISANWLIAEASDHTIFAAVPGKLAGPVKFRNGWALVVVRKAVAGHIKPLAAVKGQIATRLTRDRRRAALLSFIKSYRNKWVAKTDCSRGFVIQKCSQCHGPVASERTPLLNGNA